MFVQVPVILTRMESSIFFLDKKERSCLGEIERENFPNTKVFIKNILSSFLFFWKEGVEFSDLWGKGFGEVNLMVVRSGRRNVVGGFF